MLSRVQALQPNIPAPGLLMQRQGHRTPAAKVQRLSASGGFFGTVQRPSCKAMNSRMTCRGVVDAALLRSSGLLDMEACLELRTCHNRSSLFLSVADQLRADLLSQLLARKLRVQCL